MRRFGGKVFKLIPFLCLLMTACRSEIAELENDIDAEPFSYTITHQILGKAAYSEHCVSCHGRDLEGAAGVNLVDSVWLHGETVDEIKTNISVGFPERGMPGFAELIPEKHIDSLARYILANRQGWDTVNYKIYSVEKDSLPDFTIFKNASPVVSGQFRNGIADFERIEIPHYAVELTGSLNVPWEEEIGLLVEEAGWTNANDKTQLLIKVDGKPIEPIDKGAWDWMYPIDPGLHNLSVSYYVSGPSKPREDWTMWHRGSGRVFLARRDGSAKLTPISRKAKIEMEETTVNLEVKEHPSVVRIKTLDLPAYSVNVGLTNGVSYAFNTRSCDIVGIWYGDYLNVGPNIIGRGKEASEVLGEWAFRYPDVISIGSNKNDSQCEYEKYARGSDPSFYFKKDDVEYRLTGVSDGADLRLEISAEVSDANLLIDFAIPKIEGFDVRVTDIISNRQKKYPITRNIILEKL